MEPINEEEVKTAIRETKNKTPGLDEITKPVLQVIPAPAVRDLATIMDSALQIGHFPTPWKIARIVPIRKPMKDPKTPTSYRPISLLSIPGKVFEKILNNRLRHFIEHHKYLPENQMGFREGRGAVDQCTWLSHQITAGISRKEVTTAVLFDIEKAFDKCFTEGILYKISKPRHIPCLLYTSDAADD